MLDMLTVSSAPMLPALAPIGIPNIVESYSWSDVAVNCNYSPLGATYFQVHPNRSAAAKRVARSAAMPISLPIGTGILLLVALAPLPSAIQFIIRGLASVVLVWGTVVISGNSQRFWITVFSVLAIILFPVVNFDVPRLARMAVDAITAIVLLAKAEQLK